MKKIIVLLFILASVSFSQVTSLTSTFKLARWTAGNRLYAGTIGDTAQANASLNYNFDRIEAIIGRYIKENGRFNGIGGYGTGNFTIDGGADTSAIVRILLNDSLYGYYNWTTEGNLWVQGNATIGGYLTVDSILTTANLWIPNSLTIGGNLFVYDSVIFLSRTDIGYDLRVGTENSITGNLSFYRSENTNRALLKTALQSADRTFSLPATSADATLMTVSASDSVQTATAYNTLFNSEKVATATLDDTSALMTEWTSTSVTEYPIVRLKYVHRRGIKYVTARYYAYVAAGDNWETNIKVGALTSATDTDTNSSFGSTVQVAQLDVSGLTTNALYDLTFNIGINTTGTTHVKELVITAESN